MDKTTSIGYCASPYSPQPHNGIKLVSSANNIPAKENVSLQFRGNYIEVNGTFNISNEEFENYLEQMEDK